MSRNTYLLVLMVAVGSLGMELPKYFKKCSFNDSDSDMGLCVGDAGSRVIPKLVKGNVDFGLPPLTPFKFPDVSSPPGSSFRFKLVNGTAGDLKDVRYLSVKYNRQLLQTRGTMYLPELYVRGDYEIDGKIDNLPIHGSGSANIIFTDVACYFDWILTPLHKDNLDYYNVEDAIVKYDIGGATYSLSGLYYGDKESGEKAHQHLNKNWRTLMQVIVPGVITAFKDVSVYIARAVASKVSIKEMFII